MTKPENETKMKIQASSLFVNCSPFLEHATTRRCFLRVIYRRNKLRKELDCAVKVEKKTDFNLSESFFLLL